MFARADRCGSKGRDFKKCASAVPKVWGGIGFTDKKCGENWVFSLKRRVRVLQPICEVPPESELA